MAVIGGCSSPRRALGAPSTGAKAASWSTYTSSNARPVGSGSLADKGSAIDEAYDASLELALVLAARQPHPKAIAGDSDMLPPHANRINAPTAGTREE